MHSTCSDGILTPKQLIEELTKLKIQIFSITDHDSLTSFQYVKKEDLKFNQQIYIPGAEMSVNLDKSGRKHHITVYLPDFAIFQSQQTEIDLTNIRKKIIIKEQQINQNQLQKLDEIIKYLEVLQKNRIDRAQKIINNLNLYFNLNLDWNEFKTRITPETSVGRPMIAQYLCDKGVISYPGQAFEHYLSDSSKAFIPLTKIYLSQIVELFKPVNALLFIAHPGQWDYTQQEVKDDILEALQIGCVGFEKYHSDVMNKTYDINTCNIYSIASDFHGLSILPKCILGCPKGNELMTDEERLILISTLFKDRIQIIDY